MRPGAPPSLGPHRVEARIRTSPGSRLRGDDPARHNAQVSRLIETKRCPHCGKDLEPPIPRTCPACAGSLQQRYLRSGCLSSKPLLLLLGGSALLLFAALERLGGSA